MKIIDTHVHLSHIYSFQQNAKYTSRVDYSSHGLQQEMKDNEVVLSIGMGLREIEGGEGYPDAKPTSPMGLDMLSQPKKNILQCVGINPYRLSPTEINQIEKALLQPNVVGMKIYLGDYPFYAHDRVYEPVYDLAKAYHVPVVFHTGQTYTKKGQLKYAHPLTIDEAVMNYEEVTFVMAHLGIPWFLDAMAVMMKNSNVFATVSGFVSGDEEKVRQRMHLKDYMNFLMQGLAYCDHYERFLFGSNWPFVPMKPYIQLVKELFPVSAWNDVFYRNALEVFPKIKGFVRELR